LAPAYAIRKEKAMPGVTVTNPEFESFIRGCNQIIKNHEKGYGIQSALTLRYTEGRRYIRVMKDSSAYCFVDKTNGDVLKAASWKAPAKHARGNIFDDNNGLKQMGPYGAAYLRG
jgi:hypothetical protein